MQRLILLQSVILLKAQAFDIDSLDPAYAPGPGTLEVGGLSTREALRLIRGMKWIDIVGGDVVEVAPQCDPTTSTAQNASQMLFEILSVIYFGSRLKHVRETA